MKLAVYKDSNDKIRYIRFVSDGSPSGIRKELDRYGLSFDDVVVKEESSLPDFGFSDYWYIDGNNVLVDEESVLLASKKEKCAEIDEYKQTIFSTKLFTYDNNDYQINERVQMNYTAIGVKAMAVLQNLDTWPDPFHLMTYGNERINVTVSDFIEFSKAFLAVVSSVINIARDHKDNIVGMIFEQGATLAQKIEQIESYDHTTGWPLLKTIS